MSVELSTSAKAQSPELLLASVAALLFCDVYLSVRVILQNLAGGRGTSDRAPAMGNVPFHRGYQGVVVPATRDFIRCDADAKIKWSAAASVLGSRAPCTCLDARPWLPASRPANPRYGPNSTVELSVPASAPASKVEIPGITKP